MSAKESAEIFERLFDFECETNTLLVGPTSSGKTHLLKDIVRNGVFSPRRYTHVYVAVPEETADDWKDEPDVTIFVGIDKLDAMLDRPSDTPEYSVVIFDDFMSALDDAQRRKKLEHWFYVTSHHRKLWTFFVLHDMFNKNMTTIRRNTQNFILFDILQRDYRSASEFMNRLLGSSGGSAFILAWSRITQLQHDKKSWIRLDQKIHSPYKMVVSTRGVSASSHGQLVLRSSSLGGPLFVDAMSNPSLGDSLQGRVPDRLVSRTNRTGSEDSDDNA
jgi:hypothetical protein